MREDRLLWAAAVTGSAVAAGAAAVFLPWTVALGILAAPVVLFLLANHPTLRLLTVTVGALLVFQAPGNGPKTVYLMATLFCVAVSAVNLHQSTSPLTVAFRPMLTAAPLVLVMVLWSLIVAISDGTAPSDWLRDALPYMLLVILPVVGLEASQRLSTRTLAYIIGWVGTFAAIGLALNWLGRRGAVEGLGRVILSTGALSAFALCYALVRAARGPNRARWFVILAVIGTALVVTGSRTNLVVIAAAVVGATGAAAKARVPPPRMLQLLIFGGLAAAVIIMCLSQWFTEGFLSTRIELLHDAITGAMVQDQSFVLRGAQYDAAQQRWFDHVWVGGGPGYRYTDVHVLFGDTQDESIEGGTFSLDTPLIVPAKFGAIGVGIILFYLSQLARSVRRAPVVRDTPHATARSFAFVLIALIPFGSWLEDKGAGLALTLMLALVAAAAREERQRAEALETLPVREVAPASL